MGRDRWLALATVTVLPVLVLAVATVAAAEEEGKAEEPPSWTGSLGLSLVATGGNSDTSTVGAELQLERRPQPWGLRLGASFTRAETDGTLTAERYAANLRGERKLADRWSLFAGAGGERDQLAGLDLRTVAETGVTFTALPGPTHQLSFDGGLTWTRESFVAGGDNDFMGGLLGLAWTWKLSATAALSERLQWIPNFDLSSDWRASSETALTANLNQRLALKLGYLLRYDHLPVPGFEETDTTTTASLVVSF